MRNTFLLCCIICATLILGGCSGGKSKELCEICNSDTHTAEQCPKAEKAKCALCGSEAHDTENHPRCADCGSINHKEDECGEDAIVKCSFCGEEGHDITGCTHLGGK